MFNSYQQELPFGFQPRTRFMLAHVEQLIRKHRIVVPCPSRQTLIRMCEDGTFDAVESQPGRRGWMVYADSFWKWAGYSEQESRMAA